METNINEKTELEQIEITIEDFIHETLIENTPYYG